MVRRKKKSSVKTALLLALLVLGVGIVILLIKKNIFSIATGLLFQKQIQLKTTNNVISILLLGIGGGTHDGPDLSDTIIYANINTQKNTVDLISIPRDLWIPDVKSKINAVYAKGQNSDNKGILLSTAAVSKVVGKPIDYAIVIDFSAFVQLVDILGGVDVTVERTFDDYEYPIEGKETDLCGRKAEEIPQLATAPSQLEAFPCRYTHIRFEKGKQHMDGQTALRYVRSRHASGIEGNDFARSARQHQVISAIKEKVFSLGTLVNPVKVIGIYNVLKDNINTNVKSDEIDDFIKLAQKMKEAKITTTVLDIGSADGERLGVLSEPGISEEFGGQYVVIPRVGNGNFSEIHLYVDCILAHNMCKVNEKGIEVIYPTLTPSVIKRP